MINDAYIPPQALEAEKAVLGGVLLDNKAIHNLPPALKGEVFYVPTHGQIFSAMLALFEREAPIDVVSVLDVLKKAGNEAAAGQILELSQFGMPQSIGYHANLVLQAYRQRRSIELVRENLQALQESPDRHDEILSQLCEAITQGYGVGDKCRHIQDVMVQSIKRLEKSESSAILIPTGFA